MYKLWNNAKTTFLLAALMGLCLGIGYLIGGRRALVPALIIGGGMNVLAYFFSDRIALATMRAREISRQDDPALWETVAAVVAGAVTVLGYLVFWFGGSDDDDGNPLVALLLIILAPIAASLIQLAISRSREYEADRCGAELAGSPYGLADALRKLHAASRRIPLPVPDSQSNMFIVAPLTGRSVARLFMTHPPVEERIERLLAAAR